MVLWLALSTPLILAIFFYIMRPVVFWERNYTYSYFEAFYQKRPFVFCFLVCGLIIFLRTPEALLRSEFWAEDLSEFFVGAIALGAKSLVTPVYGYHFFVERIVAWLATFLPVYFTPFIYAWF